MEKKIYNIADAARVSGRTEQEIRDAILAGMLPAQFSSNVGDYLILAEDFDQFTGLGSGESIPKRHKVLIVDDEMEYADVLKLELERDPRITARYVSWGSDGLRAANEFRPDLVLINFELPDMTGEEALRGIRRLQHIGACKIVVYSAHAPETVALLEERLRKLGADDFTSKSPDLRALIVKVYETLGLETNTKIVRGPQKT